MIKNKQENSHEELDNHHVGGWLSCDVAEALLSQNQYKVKEEDEALLSSTCPLKAELPESTLGWPLQRLTVPMTMSQDAPQISQNCNLSPEREVDDLKLRDVVESPLSRPGWPLLRVAATSTATMSPIREAKARQNMSVVQWVMDLPSRSLNRQPQVGLVLGDVGNTAERESRGHGATKGDENCSTLAPAAPPRQLELANELEFLVEKNSGGCRVFSYAEISTATCQFSAENLIGDGGCSSVYRGCLADGESVAIKTLKSYKEALDDFFLEAKFASSMQHKHIASLVGLCVEENHLILAYELFPRGSLEGNLHDCSDETTLPWEVRFNMAVAVAEALNYLHNDCPQPIIHRDVKSSNILISNELLPQLSDFGLAIWGSTDSAYVISSDVVGTFGYIAPEYFMHGMVSDKIDVYAFGVVLLELLSGRKPVDTGAPKGQESLVKWARHLLDSMDLKALLDPKLNGDYDVVQMRRMVHAAGLCINQSARLRPRVSQVLKLLTGETDANAYFDTHVAESAESGHQDDDDFPLEVDFKSHSISAMSDTDDGSISSSSIDTASSVENQKPHRSKLKDYLTIPDHYSLSEIFLLS